MIRQLVQHIEVPAEPGEIMDSPAWMYMRTEPALWTVGFYRPDGGWEPESDLGDPDEAAARVHYLNGGCEAHE